MKNSKIVIIAIFIFSLSINFGCSRMNSENSTVDKQPIAVTAEKIITDYRQDSKAAAAKYGGRILKVSGKVNSLFTGGDGGWCVLGVENEFLNDKDEVKGVKCNLSSKDAEKLQKISSDKFPQFPRVTLAGQNISIDQETEIKLLVLENCRVEWETYKE